MNDQPFKDQGLDTASIIYYDNRDKLAVISSLEVPIAVLQPSTYQMEEIFQVSSWVIMPGKLPEVTLELATKGIMVGIEKHMLPLDESVLEDLQERNLIAKINITEDMKPTLDEFIDPQDKEFEPRRPDESYADVLSRRVDTIEIDIEDKISNSSIPDAIKETLMNGIQSLKEGDNKASGRAFSDALKQALQSKAGVSALRIGPDGEVQAIGDNASSARENFRSKSGKSSFSKRPASEDVKKTANLLAKACFPDDTKSFERINMAEELQRTLKDNLNSLTAISSLLEDIEVTGEEMEIPEISVGGDKKGSELSA